MTKQSIAAFALLFAVSGAYAKTLTPEEALARLESSSAQKAPSRMRAGARLAHTTMTEKGNPAVYLFNAAGGKGFMAVSADDCTEALLGYSDEATVGTEIPEQLAWWLGQYAEQIEYLNTLEANGQKPIKYAPKATDSRESIAPMIKTQWDQGAPYNDKCPTSGTTRTYTGCVSTAMSQVMNYWQWPTRGVGRLTYTCEGLSKKLSLNLGLKDFDWDNMLDTYTPGNYTTAEAAAVSYLMQATGYSVKMEYGTDSSGAMEMYIAPALIDNFKYNGNIEYVIRQFYSYSEWEELIYNNLKEYGPVLYGGNSFIGGGHSFVCDGYDKDGYFHFNWGWAGMSDGYFKLDALNPYALGTGGGGGGGFNFSQAATINIRPAVEGEVVKEKEPMLAQCGSLFGEVKEGVLNLYLGVEAGAMWVNYNPYDLKVQMGALFEPENGTPGKPFICMVSDRKFDLPLGYGVDPDQLKPQVDLNVPAEGGSLVDGTYKVTVVWSNPEEEDPEWYPVHASYNYSNYITLTKKGNDYKVTDEPVYLLDVKDVTVGDIYAGLCIPVKFTVENTTPRELTSGFAPAVVYNESLCMLGESIEVSLKPGESQTFEYLAELLQATQNLPTGQTVYFTFFDESTYTFYADDVWIETTLKASPGIPRPATKGAPTIRGAQTKIESVDGADVPVYQIYDSHEMIADCKVTLESGVFCNLLFACTILPTPQGLSVVSYAGYPLEMEVGKEYDFTANIANSAYAADVVYSLMMGFDYMGQLAQVVSAGQTTGSEKTDTAYFRIVSTGVESVSADKGLSFNNGLVNAADADIEIFNTAGAKVAAGYNVFDTASLPAGVYIVRAAGKTIKIAVK